MLYSLMMRSLKGLGAAVWGALLFFVLIPPFFAGAQEASGNKILSFAVEGEGRFHLRTAQPVGYRYTVYDSLEPLRVVVDFPDMDVSAVPEPAVPPGRGVKEVRLSTFDLASGQLGRVEFLLSEAADYDVTLSGNDFFVSFTPKGQAEGAPVARPPVPAVPTPPIPLEAEGLPASVSAEARAARLVEAVRVEPGRATLVADGDIGKFRYFALGAPPRLVVDLYGVKPAFAERHFPAGLGISGVRMGIYDDRTRFVLDAEGASLPPYQVVGRDRSILVSWQDLPGATVAAAPAPVPAPAAAAGGAVTVENLDFNVENGLSVFSVTLSSDAEIIPAVAEGGLVRFGVRNANISRALRRVIDPSAFPSSIRRITPYTVQEGKVQTVRFAVELKGPVPYSMEMVGDTLNFIVRNGPFAEAAPAAVGRVEVPVERPPLSVGPAATFPGRPLAAAPSILVAAPSGAKYSGQKVSLVFDDADIRKILRLIAEVSDLNIIVAEGVGGTITLQLVDVPWDQALDLILESKDLGMLMEGNVVRVLPKAKIRSMEEARLNAARTKEKLEDLSTDVISVSYSDLSNVAGPSRELLTERGTMTEDNRNKQIIVTDVPSVIEKVRGLIAILDTPERQVMIEARIVEAVSDFSHRLGVSWLFQHSSDTSKPNETEIGAGGSFLIEPGGALTNGLGGLGAGFTFGRAGIDSTILDLRLAASETVGDTKIISKPRVTTLNGEQAKISQGTQIPYTSSGSDGLPKTEFVDANLELIVTPIINPDNSIILEIKATKDSPKEVDGADSLAIDTKEAQTKVLVRNGETTVIGGIFTEDERDSEAGVPYLMDLPILGHFFKSHTVSNNRTELLIFITPRIVE